MMEIKEGGGCMKKRDEFSFIGFAFPISFGVLLISYLFNYFAIQMNSNPQNSFVMFNKILNVIGIIMLYGSMLISFIIIIRYAFSEDVDVKSRVKKYVKIPAHGKTAFKNPNGASDKDLKCETITKKPENDKDLFDA